MRNGTFGFYLISWRWRRRRRCHCLKSLLTSSNKLDTNIDFSCVWISRSCFLSVPLSSFHQFPKLSDCCLKTCTTFWCRDQDNATRSMAETLPKLTSSRAGYHAQLTKTLNKAKDLMKIEAPTEMDVVSLNSIIEQLTRKKSILTGLDEKIVKTLEHYFNCLGKHKSSVCQSKFRCLGLHDTANRPQITNMTLLFPLTLLRQSHFSECTPLSHGVIKRMPQSTVANSPS